MEHLVVKMSHIGVIQMLQEKIGNGITPFKKLEKMPNHKLEIFRDELVWEYNIKVELEKKR